MNPASDMRRIIEYHLNKEAMIEFLERGIIRKDDWMVKGIDDQNSSMKLKKRRNPFQWLFGIKKEYQRKNEDFGKYIKRISSKRKIFHNPGLGMMYIRNGELEHAFFVSEYSETPAGGRRIGFDDGINWSIESMTAFPELNAKIPVMDRKVRLKYFDTYKHGGKVYGNPVEKPIKNEWHLSRYLK